MKHKKSGQPESPRPTTVRAKAAASTTALQPGSETDGDRAWRIAQLASTLASTQNIKEGGLHGLPINPRIASAEMDAYFSAALKRADVLLSWAEGKGGDLHAYQLFEEGVTLTEAQIVEVLRTVHWGEIQSKQPLMKLMSNIREVFDDELHTQQSLTMVNVEFVALEDNVESAIKRAFEKHFGPPLEKLDKATGSFVSDLVATVRERLSVHFFGPHQEEFMAFHEMREFHEWCFPVPKTKDAATRAERLYRPHEIFRRCAARQWFEGNLVRPRKRLSSSFVPYPPMDLQHENYSLFMRYYESSIHAAVPSVAKPSGTSGKDQAT